MSHVNNENFQQYGLDPEILEALRLLHYEKPTPVQAQVIPAVLAQRDVLVQSQTGSGKTAAFAIPLCQQVNWEENKPQVLVLAPTRELALQIKEAFFHIGRFKRLKAVALYGRDPFYGQARALKQKTHVVVGTPGRTLDHLERGTLDPSKLRFLVLDEADEMLSMGFLEQLTAILEKLPGERVTMLFSATLPKELVDLKDHSLKDPLRIEIEGESSGGERILQEAYLVEAEQKPDLLEAVLILENPDSCLIFCNTKQQVDQVYEALEAYRGARQKLHGGMEQPERIRVMERFKAGAFRYLVATDVAARGIDVDQISLVINYDFPREQEGYVHRIGRTGRIGRAGKALTFVEPAEQAGFEALAAALNQSVSLLERPSSAAVEQARASFEAKLSRRPDTKEKKGESLQQNIMKLHINAGKKTKMRPVDIVGTLCNLEGMTAADIGIIQIEDISTFVEILNGKGEQVLEALQTTAIKGRLRRVSRATR